jgi:pimeloyl-ACP methyl ester carboxylesterase
MNKQKHFYLIRGLARESRHWDDFPRELLKHFPDARLSTLDIPGAGELVDSPTPLSVRAMPEAMHRKYTQQRKDGEQAILIAVSLGGMIATAWMQQYPEDFSRAILMNTSLGGLSRFYHRLRPSALIHLARTPVRNIHEKEAHVLRLVCNNKDRFDKTLGLWVRLASESPISTSNALRQLLAAALYRGESSRPRCEILLLGSTNDRMVNIKCSRTIAKAWKVPLVEHPQGGHDLSSDHPEWVALEVKKFITA